MALPVEVSPEVYKLDFVRPALGERLVARAEAAYRGRTHAACTIVVMPAPAPAEGT